MAVGQEDVPEATLLLVQGHSVVSQLVSVRHPPSLTTPSPLFAGSIGRNRQMRTPPVVVIIDELLPLCSYCPVVSRDLEEAARHYRSCVNLQARRCFVTMSDDESINSVEWYYTGVANRWFRGFTTATPYEIVEYCRERDHEVWELEIFRRHFHSDSRWGSTQLADTSVDTLEVEEVTFRDRPTAVQFAELMSHLKAYHVVLGRLFFRFERSDDIRSLIFTNAMQSSVERVTFPTTCHPEAIRLALEAGREFLQKVSVKIAKEEDLVLLADAISKMAKLEVLRFSGEVPIQPKTKRYFCRAIDACATPISIQVIGAVAGNWTQAEMQMLRRGRKKRNKALRRFVLNPTSYTQKELLVLMLKLEHCPTGLYELVRALPIGFLVATETQTHTGRANKRTRF